MLFMLIASVLAAVAVAAVAVAAAHGPGWLRRQQTRRRSAWGLAPTAHVVGFFHPHCYGGGGGERVLWTAIHAIQTARPEQTIALYCQADPRTADLTRLLDLVKTQFRIAVRPERLVLVRLQSCRFAEAKTWPRLTLILQSLGAIIPAIEALWKLPCHVFVETVGYAFVYPVARLWACTVVTYTHYPTISTNMLDKVASRRPDFNNSSLIARYPLLSHIKYAYYRLFAALYGAAGRAAHVVMLNSRWTAAHVCALWHLPPAAAPSPSAAAASRRQAFLVYPPCDTEALQQSSLDERTRTIVYVAQFRPEKAHPLVLEAFAAALADPGLSAADADAAATWRLELIGGARHPADQARAAALAARARHHGLADRVVLRPNAPYPVLAQALATAAIGVHAMADEHFGICIVEYMAAGCLVLAHGSGGPATDILDPGVSGVLATTLAEYTAGLVHLMTMPPARQLAMRTAARTKAATFSNARFHDGWMAVLSPLLPPEPRGRKNP